MISMLTVIALASITEERPKCHFSKFIGFVSTNTYPVMDEVMVQFG